MKGMTLDQYKEVIEFLQENHRFAGYKSPEKRKLLKEAYPNFPEYGYGIKYVDCTYDSRTQTIWSVTFRGIGVTFRTNQYTALSYTLDKVPEGYGEFESLYDICMAFLKGDFKPTKEFMTHE